MASKSSSDSTRNIHQRLIEVQKKVTTVVKNEKVSMGTNNNYKAVSHDDVASLLHGPLAENGIVLLPDVIFHEITSFEKEKMWKGKSQGVTTWYRCDLEINVKWINADNPSDFIESHSAAFALDTSDKCFAKAYSLALKICLLKVHLLESRDEEEQRVFESNTTPTQHVNEPSPEPPKKPAPKFSPKIQELIKIKEELGISDHLMPNIVATALGEKKKVIEMAPLEVDQVIEYMKSFGGGK